MIDFVTSTHDEGARRSSGLSGLWWAKHALQLSQPFLSLSQYKVSRFCWSCSAIPGRLKWSQLYAVLTSMLLEFRGWNYLQCVRSSGLWILWKLAKGCVGQVLQFLSCRAAALDPEKPWSCQLSHVVPSMVWSRSNRRDIWRCASPSSWGTNLIGDLMRTSWKTKHQTESDIYNLHNLQYRPVTSDTSQDDIQASPGAEQ